MVFRDNNDQINIPVSWKLLNGLIKIVHADEIEFRVEFGEHFQHFSETSLNAARYAADMLRGKEDARIILYHMFKEADEAVTAGQYLESLKAEMEQKGVLNIELEKELGDDLIDHLGRLAYQKTAELIIMGISEKDEWRQLFIGSNTLKMAEENICPVMIIPGDAKYNGITNIALTSDFKDVDATTPVLAIKKCTRDL